MARVLTGTKTKTVAKKTTVKKAAPVKRKPTATKSTKKYRINGQHDDYLDSLREFAPNDKSRWAYKAKEHIQDKYGVSMRTSPGGANLIINDNIAEKLKMPYGGEDREGNRIIPVTPRDIKKILNL